MNRRYNQAVHRALRLAQGDPGETGQARGQDPQVAALRAGLRAHQRAAGLRSGPADGGVAAQAAGGFQGGGLGVHRPLQRIPGHAGRSGRPGAALPRTRGQAGQGGGDQPRQVSPAPGSGVGLSPGEAHLAPLLAGCRHRGRRFPGGCAAHGVAGRFSQADRQGHGPGRPGHHHLSGQRGPGAAGAGRCTGAGEEQPAGASRHGHRRAGRGPDRAAAGERRSLCTPADPPC